MTGRSAAPGPGPAPMTSRPDGVRHGMIVARLEQRPDVSRHPPDIGDNLGSIAGDIVDEWGKQSFPASDPPANW
jgi:hypothetical protein